MATAVEVSNVIDWIKERWPTASGYRHWERVARDFALIPVEAMHSAARNHYDAGSRTAPTFAELKSESARIAAERGMVDPRSVGCDVRGRHSRNWAVTDLGRNDPEGRPLREGQCLDCGAIVIRPAHQLLTVGEVEEIRRVGRQDTTQNPAAAVVKDLVSAMDIDKDGETDRIAP